MMREDCGWAVAPAEATAEQPPVNSPRLDVWGAQPSASVHLAARGNHNAGDGDLSQITTFCLQTRHTTQHC